MRILYLYATFSGDIRYNNRSYTPLDSLPLAEHRVKLSSGVYLRLYQYLIDLKNIKNVKGCRDGMPKSMQTR